MSSMDYIRIPALRVRQPLGDFYSVKLSAKQLQEITYSARAKYERHSIVGSVFERMSGTQRRIDDKREKEIGRFIDSSESAFPNAIILGANFDESGMLVRDPKRRWRVESVDSDFYYLCIPSNEKMASIIDGQHRLSGFKHSEREDMDLLCSIYLDLPAPYQAYIFATINFNQKKVDKSLAYELYGFSLSDETRNSWSPEKLAVYIARVLRFKKGPLVNKIALGVAVEFDSDGKELRDNESVVSLSTIVDGILSLLSNNPRKDRDDIQNYKNKVGRKTLEMGSGSQPLRAHFIRGEDEYIESTVIEFLTSFHDVLMVESSEDSYLRKTVGFIGAFSFLKDYLKKRQGSYDDKEIIRVFTKAREIDFSVSFFSASAVGASRIKNVFLLISEIRGLEHFADSKDYAELVEVANPIL